MSDLLCMKFHEEHFRSLQYFLFPSRRHRSWDIRKKVVKNMKKGENLNLYPFEWVFRLIGKHRLTREWPILQETWGTFSASTMFSLGLMDCEIFAKLRFSIRLNLLRNFLIRLLFSRFSVSVFSIFEFRIPLYSKHFSGFVHFVFS